MRVKLISGSIDTLGTAEERERYKYKWIEKKSPLVKNLDETIALNEETLRSISAARASINEATTVLKNDQMRLYQIREVYKSNAYLPDNPVTTSSVAIMTSLSVTGKESARHMASLAGAIKTNTDSFTGSTLTSGSIVASMASATVYMADRMIDLEPVLPVITAMRESTAQNRQSELSTKLATIEPRLETKLHGAWQTLNDTSKEDRFSQAANSAREVISDLLIILAPDDKVVLMHGFKPETENGRPSQRQRARYAILGSNTSLSENDLKPIYDLCDNIRDSYRALNPLSHLRNYTDDLQKMTESIIDEAQIYLLKLLVLRGKYFVA